MKRQLIPTIGALWTLLFAAFIVWLYQIARHKAVDRLASRDPIGTLEEEHAVSATAGTNSEPEFSPEDAARIHAQLARLRPAHREVLLLRFMEDLSYEQIADVTGCTVGTVRSRLHYGKLALRKLMEDTP